MYFNVNGNKFKRFKYENNCTEKTIFSQNSDLELDTLSQSQSQSHHVQPAQNHFHEIALKKLLSSFSSTIDHHLDSNSYTGEEESEHGGHFFDYGHSQEPDVVVEERESSKSPESCSRSVTAKSTECTVRNALGSDGVSIITSFRDTASGILFTNVESPNDVYKRLNES